MLATATSTDPLGGTDTVSQSIAAGGATGLRVVRRSAFDTRVNWGSAIDNEASTQGPNLVTEGLTGPDYQFAPDPPITLGHTFTMQRSCNIVGARIYKSPLLAGSIPVALWDNDGTELAIETVTWVADEGGWRTVEFTTPAAVTSGQEYTLGYHVNSFNYAYSMWVFSPQDYIVYPFIFKSLFQAGGLTRDGMARLQGASITFPGPVGTSRSPANYYIDPIAEWTETLPGYVGGNSYYDQWETAGSRFAFPIGVFFADPPFLEDYAALGVNTLIAGDASEEYIDAVIASDMDWYPTLHGGDMTSVVVTQEETSIQSQVRGYLLTDEPDLITPYNSPTELREWFTACRNIDSTRPIVLNLSYLPVKNQGFVFQPTGASPLLANANFRLYAQMADILSCDFYSLAGSDSFNPSNAEIEGTSTGRYGIWAYPAQVKRMRELTDERAPTWGYVETTSGHPDLPTTDQVEKATWALLIAGARGIVFFDKRFANIFGVTTDLNAMIADPVMSAAVAALSSRLQSLGDALMSVEVDLVSSVDSSNTTEGPIGGTYGVPIHYTSRQIDDTRYLFAQAIRPGATTATFVVPDAAGETITVIDEGRTLTASGGGVIVDTFAADYTYHLYTWGDVVEGGGATYTDSGDGDIVASGTGTDEYLTGGSSFDDSASGTIIASGSGTEEHLDEGTGARGFPAFGSAGLAHSDDPLLEPTSAITVEAWINPITIGFVQWQIAGKGGVVPSGGGTYRLGMLSNEHFCMLVNTVGGWTYAESTITAEIGETHHVVGTYDGTTTRIYVNGALDGSSTDASGSLLTNSDPFVIGDSPLSDVIGVEGVLDEVALYPTALSGARIAAHYAAGTGGGDYAAEVMADDPNGYWRMDDLTDSSGNGLTLTASGADTTEQPPLITTGSGGGGELSLSRVAWEGADYYTVAENGPLMAKAEAYGFGDPELFPISVWGAYNQHETFSGGTTNGEYDQSIGINGYVWVGTGDEELLEEDNIHIASLGMWAIQAHDNFPDASGNETIGWLIEDEIDMTVVPPADAFTELDTYLATAPLSTDNTRFLFNNFGKGVGGIHGSWGSPVSDADLETFVGYTHLFSSDIYWFTDPWQLLTSPAPDYMPESPSDITGSEVRRAKNYGYQMAEMHRIAGLGATQLPAWAVIEVGHPFLDTEGDDPADSTHITPSQCRGAIWHSICNEARGIMYFQHSRGGTCVDNHVLRASCNSTVTAVVAAANALITSLAPVLNTQSYVWDFEATNVTTMLKVHEGYAYIFAILRDAGSSGSKTFTLPPEITGTDVEVIDESRSLTVTAGEITDTFANDTTPHIYKVAI